MTFWTSWRQQLQHALADRSRRERLLAMGGSIFLVIAIVVAIAVQMQPAQPPAAPLSTAAESGQWSPVWPVIATLIVLGALYLTLYILRRWNPAATGGVKGPLLAVQSSVRLSSNQALHVVQFGDQTLLVGASPAGLVLLSQCEAIPTRFEQTLRDAREMQS
jgi:flagellar biogenesis protein FliO